MINNPDKTDSYGIGSDWVGWVFFYLTCKRIAKTQSCTWQHLNQISTKAWRLVRLKVVPDQRGLRIAHTV